VWAALSSRSAPLPASETRDWAPTAASSYELITQYPIGGTHTGYGYDLPAASTPRTRLALMFARTRNRVEFEIYTGKSSANHGDARRARHRAHSRARKGLYQQTALERTVTVFESSTRKFRKLIRYMGVKPEAIQ